MKILSIDTSTKNFSLAVSDGSKILVSSTLKLDKILSESIIPAIDQSLKKAKVPLAKIDGFAVGLGPGSFTSLRVGLATVKALHFATGKPVVGIPSLDVLAMSVKDDDDQICAMTDARRNMIYACLYAKKNGDLKRKSDYWLMTIKDLLKKIKGKAVLIGDGLTLLKNEKFDKKNFCLAPEKLWYPEAGVLSQLALKRFKARQTDDVNRLVPLYLYPEDCQVKKETVINAQ